MALRMMNNAVEVEDVLQEGFVYIWQRAAALMPAAAVSCLGR